MELFKLFGTIAIDTAEAKKRIKELSEEGGKAEQNLSKLGEGAVKAGKFIVSGLAAGAGAIATIGGFAVKAYAEYEQLAGGAQLLFGEAYGYIDEQAKNAFKTVQMSTNEYLQQVNGFSTGLKTALGGNEQAAAELAHKIIVAEADIVAATGNSAENVQNAFNGIMKSNFTMLDNLQLGITPTKEGFQEVIKKVNEWNKANGEATKYQIDNLADCQAALIDYIEMQGLSGYAAKEASGTISGSFAMTKSAWDNLLVGLASGNADIPTLVSDVVTSGAKVIENIIPVAKDVLLNLPKAISEISPEAGAAFQGIIDGFMEILPTLKDALTTTFDIVKNVITFMTEHQGLMIGIAAAIGTVVTALGLYNAVQAIKTALDITGTLTLGSLTTAIWANVAATAAMLAPYVAIVAAVAAVIAIGVLLYKNWDEIKAKCIELAQNLKQKFNEMKTAVVDKVTELKEKAVQKFNDVKTSIVNICGNVVDWVKNNWKSILTFFINPFAGLFSYFYENNSKFREFVDNAINEIKQLPSKAWTWLKNTISKVTSFVTDLANKGKQAGKNLFDNVVNGIKELPSKMASTGKDVVQGIWKGITNAKDWLLNKIKGFAKTITKGIKDFFGIKSPSRVMRDEVGKQLAEGIAVGITDNSKKAETAADKLGQNILSAAQKRLDDYKVYNELTLADEVGYWDAVRVQITEGTDARIEADKKYFEAKKSLVDEEKRLAEEEVKIYEKVAEAGKELQKKLDEIAAKFAERVKSIAGNFSLFGGIGSEYSMSDLLNGKHKNDLFSGLETDISDLEDWTRQTERLKNKIGDTELYKEIYDSGFEALPQIRMLNSLSEEELQRYVDLYDKKMQLATSIASSELEKQTLDETRGAYQDFADKCIESGVKIVESFSKVQLNINTKFPNVAKTITTVGGTMLETWKRIDSELTETFKKVVATHEKLAGEYGVRRMMPQQTYDFSGENLPGIKWHASAVNSPRILDKPTIFGYSSKSGSLLGGGEAGSELIGGVDTVKGMIQDAVSSENRNLENVLYKILQALLSMDSNMGGHLKEALENMSLDVNKREFARLVKAVN